MGTFIFYTFFERLSSYIPIDSEMFKLALTLSVLVLATAEETFDKGFGGGISGEELEKRNIITRMSDAEFSDMIGHFFDEADANKDGALVVDEFKTLLTEVSMVGVAGDEEATEMVKESLGGLTEGEWQDQFEGFDGGDGKITRQEAIQTFSALKS